VEPGAAITAASAPAPVGVVAGARQFARSVVVGLIIAGVITLVGPVLSYRADVATIREELQLRVSREAQVYAQAVSLYLGLLQSDLERLAQRPEVNLFDGSSAPEQVLLDATHHGSALFGVGVAVLDREGRPVWSEPPGLVDPGMSLLNRRWFQELLERGAPVFDSSAAHSRTFVVGVPIVRGGKIGGALAGFIDAGSGPLPGWQRGLTNDDILVTNAAGDVFLPEPPPDWTRATNMPALMRLLLAAPQGALLTLNGRHQLAAATAIGSTGLRLALVADEDRVIAPARARLLWQLAVVGLLQLATITLFSVFFRRIYRTFLRVETHAAAQERMAALGAAASLIAHEVKNSLNGLRAAVATQEAEGSGGLATRAIRGQTDRLAHLATSLLHFGKPAEPRAVDTRLDQLALEAVDGLRVLPEFDEVRLTTDLADAVPVTCDPLLVATALDNLIRNAVEAGVVAKDLGAVDEPAVRIAAGRDDGQAYVLVEDNAGGPAPDVEAHLFEPFVTGKPKGIGLGLAMARRAMEQQGGSLSFERGASGSRFVIRLPVAPSC
jgi:signal transduction histidine kinase